MQNAAPAGGMKSAGGWIRFVAYIIDVIILAIIGWIVGMAVNQSEVGNVMLVIGIVYIIGFWGWKSATPGKMALGLKIVTAQGGKLTWGKAILRYVGYFVSGIILGIGYLMVFFTENKKGLHDMIAGTRVVKK